MAAETMIDRTTATMAPGTSAANRLKPRMMARVASAKANVSHWIAPRCVIRSHCCWNQVPVPFGMPEHVGDLAGEDLHADTGEEADEHRGAEEVAEEAEPEEPGDEQQDAADERDERCSRPATPASRA